METTGQFGPLERAVVEHPVVKPGDRIPGTDFWMPYTGHPAKEFSSTAYLNLKTPARVRLQMLRYNVGWFQKRNPGTSVQTWRDCRFANLRGDGSGADLSAGINTERGTEYPVWYTFANDGGMERVQAVHDVMKDLDRRFDHTGWYADPDGNNLYVGQVAKLPHGRYLAGYHMTDSGEWVWFQKLYDDLEEAARAADGHAEYSAGEECEYQTRWREARDIEDEIEEHGREARKCYSLRHHPLLGAEAREELADLFEDIRKKRQRLADDYKDVD